MWYRKTVLEHLTLLTFATLASTVTYSASAIEAEDFPKPDVSPRLEHSGKPASISASDGKVYNTNLVAPLSTTGLKNILFIVDYSRSMKSAKDPKVKKVSPKYESVLAVLKQSMALVPDTVALGLRLYGAKEKKANQPVPGTECANTKLVLPLHTNNNKQLLKELDEWETYGLSPLTYSLHAAFEKDLKDVKEKTLVILLTEGLDTCGHDPVDFVRSRKNQISPIVVISFATNPKYVGRKLNAIAQYSSGLYFESDKLTDYWALLKKIKIEQTEQPAKALKGKAKSLRQ